MKKFFLSLFLILGILSVLLVSKPSLLSETFRGVFPSHSPQIGAFFYYWYHCPQHYCDKNYMVYIPSNVYTYSSQNIKWYEEELRSMEQAGLDIVFPVSWGNRSPNAPWFNDTTTLPLLLQAMKNVHSPLKIALFDDTSSEYAEWNLDHKRGYQQPDNPDKQPKMPLDDQKNWIYFYDHKIHPFYKMIPQELWATHNGLPIDEGGKPVIVVYKSHWFSKLESGPSLWKQVKNKFVIDFGVEPFIILDKSWFLYKDGWQMEEVADGKYMWSGSIDDERRQTHKDYTTVALNPGVGCTNNQTGCDYYRLRNTDFVTQQTGDEGARMRSMYHALVPGSNLVLVETWNELWEGTMIGRSPFYPKNGGGHLPEDYYMKLLRKLKGS